MQKFSVMLACVACVGHGRRVQVLHQRSPILESLSARAPEAAFNPSGPVVGIPMGNPRIARPEMRLFGQPAVGEPSKKDALELKSPNSDLKSPDTIRALNIYADAFDEAESTSAKKDVLDLRSRVLGPDHADTLRALTDYGSTLSDGHPESQGESPMKKMLEHSRKALQKRHEHEAKADIALMKDILDLKLKRIGADHPETLISLSNYADTLEQCGKHAHAARMKRQVLEISRQILGPDHPDTLKALSSYADILSELGRDAEAEPLRKEGHLLSRLSLGTEHPDTIKALGKYAETLVRLGRHTEAEPMLKEVLDVTSKRSGAEHPDTIRASNMYAKTLGALGFESEEAQVKSGSYELSPDILDFMDDYDDTLSALSQHSMDA